MINVQQLCHGVDQIAMTLLDRKLLTINIFHAQHMELERLYSSNPEAYPAGDRKQKKGTVWGQHVLIEQKIFVGEGSEAIQQSFDDHETIQRLGLQSIINIPISSDSLCLGTLNILMTLPYVKSDHIETARHLGALLRPGLITLRSNIQK
jgi:transcriptional regulator with GAF, ATPase, and Fis domain